MPQVNYNYLVDFEIITNLNVSSRTQTQSKIDFFGVISVCFFDSDNRSLWPSNRLFAETTATGCIEKGINNVEVFVV